MKLSEFIVCTQLSKEQLIAHSYGRLVEDVADDFIRLPAPPFLMIDRILDIVRDGSRGRIIAERDVKIDDWFFGCHFISDPVQPGCLGVDAIWQLIGLYIGLCGDASSGRALGCKEVDFKGQIRPHNKVVRYEVEIRRYTRLVEQGAVLAIGDGEVFVDGELIYSIRAAKVGAFKGIAYQDYPLRTKNSIGGIMER